MTHSYPPGGRRLGNHKSWQRPKTWEQTAYYTRIWGTAAKRAVAMMSSRRKEDNSPSDLIRKHTNGVSLRSPEQGWKPGDWRWLPSEGAPKLKAADIRARTQLIQKPQGEGFNGAPGAVQAANCSGEAGRLPGWGEPQGSVAEITGVFLRKPGCGRTHPGQDQTGVRI